MPPDPDLSLLALRGLRVLEIGSGPALAYAGKLFSDFGAEVIKVEPRAGDPWRQMPPLVEPSPGAPPESALFAWMNTHKRSVTADATETAGPQAPAWLAALARSCDVVLDARALAQGVSVLATPLWVAAPGEDPAGHVPIQVDLTWFGAHGPYAGYRGSEAVCRALAGAVHASGPVEGPPHMPHDLQTGIVGGLGMFSAAVAAWIGRGQGSRRYTLSLHELAFGVVEMEAGMVLDGRHPQRRLGVNRFCGTHPAGIYETAEGWIGIFTHTLPQWTALCEALGRSDWARDPRFAAGPDSMQHADEVEAFLVQAFRQRSAQEWLAELGARKHPVVLVPTMAQLLQQPVHRQRGAFAQVGLGAARFEGPAVPLPLGAAGPHRQGQAPALGADNAWYRAGGLARAVAPRRPAPREHPPLQGLRVIDLSMGWAGPLASRTLADLGADVIKVESTSYPDWWRGANFTEAFYRDRLYEKNSNFNMMNRHKRGITLDLTHPEGRQLLLRLVETADALIENYSAEVLPKLGLDAPALRAANPGLLTLSMPAFGLGNAWSHLRAYGGTLEQASGLPLYTGHPQGPPAMTSYAYGDPIGGLNAGAAMLLGLLLRQSGGQGRHIDLSQVEAMLPLAAPFLVAQSATGQVPPRQGNRHPVQAPQGCYRCAGDDAWIVLGLTEDAQWPALCRLLGRDDLARDPALALAAGRRARHERLDEAITAWTLQHPADEAMQRLQAAGVPAGVVRPMAQVLADPHLAARGFWCEVERAQVGRFPCSTPPFRQGAGPEPIQRVAPTLGQHNAEVLGGLLGLGPEALAALEHQGITGTTARPKPPGRAA